jgi:hypothetical protein
MGMPWVKLYTDLLDDPKVGFLSEGAQLLFVKLILLAGECDAEGYIANGEDPLTTQQIAWRLRIPPNEVKSRLAEIASAGLIEDEDGIILLINFQKRQGRSQSEKREAWRERKRKQRQARDSENVTRDTTVTPARVTPLEGEGEGEREKEGEGEEEPPPSSPAVAVWEEVFGEQVPQEYWPEEIARIVGTAERDLTLWRACLQGWKRSRYKADNIVGQLDRYQKDRTGRNGGNSQTGPPDKFRSTVDEMAALLERND